MKRARRDPLTAGLIRAITGRIDAPVAVVRADSLDWASATFIGARHELILLVGGEDAAARAEALVAALPEHEFVLRGHIVAEAVASASRSEDGAVRLTVEVLTIED